MKRLLCGLLVLIMLMSALAACGDKNVEGESESISESESQTQPEEEISDTIDLVIDSKPMYYILCEDEDTHTGTLTYVIEELRKKSGGISFEHTSTKKENSELHMICIGGDYDALFPDSEAKMTYSGYAAAIKDGDIYLCANTAGNVKKAATKWLTSIVVKECVKKDENGLTDVSIPKSTMFLYDPDYIISDPKILSVPMKEYSIVIPKDSDYTQGYTAKRLAQGMALLTGQMLDIIEKGDTLPERAIVIEKNGEDKYAWSVKSDGTRIYVNYGSTYAFEKIMDNFRGIFSEGKIDLSGRVDERITIEKNADEIRVMTSNVLFTDHGSIPYSNRADLLADLYLDFMPDFIGLQEAQGGIGAAIYEGIKERYERISQISGHTPVLYRKDIWRPVTDSEGATVKNAVHETNCWGFEWVMFERIDDPTVKVIVGNLHFPPSSYSTRRPAAMNHFNNEIKRLESEYKDIPIFATGDYNTKVTGKRHTGLDDGWEEDIIVDTTLQSGGQLTEDTDDKNKTTIDHICVSSKLVEVVRHRGVSYETMKNSSDHRPYFVDIKLK